MTVCSRPWAKLCPWRPCDVLVFPLWGIHLANHDPYYTGPELAQLIAVKRPIPTEGK